MLLSSSYRSAGTSPCVFVCDTDTFGLQSIEEALSPQYELRTFDREAHLLDAFQTMPRPDVTLLGWDFQLDSTATLKQILEACAGSQVLLISGPAGAEHRAYAMDLGVSGVLERPFEERDLCEAVEQVLQMPSAAAPVVAQNVAQNVVQDLAQSVARNNEATPLGDGNSFVRSSKKMREIEAQAALVARSMIPVLVLGESGTGKEVLAKYTHLMSDRANNMFLKVNCAAMPADLLESELFGYEKGAFTGAVKDKPGKFEICNGGTIFLDEIGEMPPVLQAKLLHVLQDGTYSRLGGRSTMKVDVRVIAATNVNLKAAMANKTFREDLYYRLNGFSLTLPPLRERADEVPVFARHFMEKCAAKYGRDPLPLSGPLLAALAGYSWPGNLRELENVINRYLVIGDEQSIIGELTAQAASSRAAESVANAANGPGDGGLKQLVRTLKGGAESVAIANVLEEKRWNRKAAAREMKISYKALLYKIKQYDLTPRTLG